MKIKEIISQHRRDFTATFECEHCGHEVVASGYDDANFHENVVPNFICPECSKKASDTYRPLKTKYPEGYQI
jgi:transcription elongation factor Elf1